MGESSDNLVNQRSIAFKFPQESLPLRKIMARMTKLPAETTVRDDLYHLKKLGMVVLERYGRGAKWFLVREENNEPNKPVMCKKIV